MTEYFPDRVRRTGTYKDGKENRGLRIYYETGEVYQKRLYPDTGGQDIIGSIIRTAN